MRTRIIALIIAVILAIVGGVLLVQYVRDADQRAADGAELTDVLVITEDVPSGTPASQLALFVEPRSIPAAFLAEGAITDLDELAELDGYVTTATLVSGEQLIRERFESPDAFVDGGGSVQIPEGLQEISVSLDASRVIGGRLAAGDLAGVYVSFEGDDVTPRQTKLLLERILVTAVSGGAGSLEAGTGTPGTVTVTLAVSERDAQAIIYSSEFAQLWLSKQNESTAGRAGTPFTFQELAQ